MILLVLAKTTIAVLQKETRNYCSFFVERFLSGELGVVSDFKKISRILSFQAAV